MEQTYKEQWWLKKKGRFSVNATWVNCNVNLKIPSEKALFLTNEMDPKNEDAQLEAITNFLIEVYGPNFHNKY